MVAPVVRCQACWRDAAQVSYCVSCGLVLCDICRGDDPVVCSACTRSSMRSRRGVVALARRSTALLDDAAREAEGLARRIAEGRDRQWLTTTEEYRAQFMDALESDFVLLRAKGDAADRAGAFAAVGFPPRSRGRADEVAVASQRFAAATDAARRRDRRPDRAAVPAARRARILRAAPPDRGARPRRPGDRGAAGDPAPHAEPLIGDGGQRRIVHSCPSGVSRTSTPSAASSSRSASDGGEVTRRARAARRSRSPSAPAGSSRRLGARPR